MNWINKIENMYGKWTTAKIMCESEFRSKIAPNWMTEFLLKTKKKNRVFGNTTKIALKNQIDLNSDERRLEATTELGNF